MATGAPVGRDVGGAHPIRHTAQICDFCKETQQSHPEWGGHGERTRPTLVTTMRRYSASTVIELGGHCKVFLPVFRVTQADSGARVTPVLPHWAVQGF